MTNEKRYLSRNNTNFFLGGNLGPSSSLSQRVMMYWGNFFTTVPARAVTTAFLSTSLSVANIKIVNSLW